MENFYTIDQERFNRLADDATIGRTVKALMRRNINALVVNTRHEAKEKVLSFIPPGSKVMPIPSTTIDAVGLTEEINSGTRYQPFNQYLFPDEEDGAGAHRRKLEVTPEWVVGSVRAVTEHGKVYVALVSNGDLPPYAYGSPRVILIAGAHKIVKTTSEAVERTKYYYATWKDAEDSLIQDNSGFITRILMVRKRVTPGRITLILVKEAIGF